MLDMKLGRYNIINKGDKKYYYKCYKVVFNISNAVNPFFRVYANNELQALEIILDKLIEYNQEYLFFISEDEYQKEGYVEFENDYINIGGYYLNSGYLYIEEIETI